MSFTKEDSSILVDSTETRPKTKPLVWVGRILSGLAAGLLLFSGAMKVAATDQVLQGFSEMGYPNGVAMPIGVVEILCALLYLVPQTAVLGAILITGYLGGATDVHVRNGQQVFIPVALGVVAWLGLYLRDPRLRALLPLRTLPGPAN